MTPASSSTERLLRRTGGANSGLSTNRSAGFTDRLRTLTSHKAKIGVRHFRAQPLFGYLTATAWIAQKSEARWGRSKRRRQRAKVGPEYRVRSTEYRGQSRPQPDPIQACPYPQGQSPRETINGGVRRGSLGRYAVPTLPATGINVLNGRRRGWTALGGGFGAAGGGKRQRCRVTVQNGRRPVRRCKG